MNLMGPTAVAMYPSPRGPNMCGRSWSDCLASNLTPRSPVERWHHGKPERIAATEGREGDDDPVTSNAMMIQSRPVLSVIRLAPPFRRRQRATLR